MADVKKSSRFQAQGGSFKARGMTTPVPCPGCDGTLTFSSEPPAAYHMPADACTFFLKRDVLSIIRTVNNLMEKKQ